MRTNPDWKEEHGMDDQYRSSMYFLVGGGVFIALVIVLVMLVL